MEKKHEFHLFLVAKFPRLGRCKTRLQPTYTEEFSLKFTQNCILDLTTKFNNITEVDLKKHILFGPKTDEIYFKEWFLEQNINNWDLISTDETESLSSLLQYGINHIISNKKHISVGFIGMDQPHIDTSSVIKAYQRSLTNSLIATLYPVEDGGYSFLCFTLKVNKNVFKNVEWSTLNTCTSQQKALEDENYSVLLEEYSFDIDEPLDILKLINLFKINEKLTKSCQNVSLFLKNL